MVYNWPSSPVIKAQVFLALMPRNLCQRMFIRAVKAHISSCEKLMALSLIMTDRGCILRMIALVVLQNCCLWKMLIGWLRKGKQVVCSSFNVRDSASHWATLSALVIILEYGPMLLVTASLHQVQKKQNFPFVDYLSASVLTKAAGVADVWNNV